MVAKQKEKGFLLIEVVIAMVIISIALVAATGMFIQATRANSEAEQYTTATTLAQEQLERLKKTANDSSADTAGYLAYWKTFNVGSTINRLGGTGANPNSVPLNNITYTVTTTVVSVDNPARLVEVKVEVTWSGTKSVVMTALYPKIKLPM